MTTLNATATFGLSSTGPGTSPPQPDFNDIASMVAEVPGARPRSDRSASRLIAQVAAERACSR